LNRSPALVSWTLPGRGRQDGGSGEKLSIRQKCFVLRLEATLFGLGIIESLVASSGSSLQYLGERGSGAEPLVRGTGGKATLKLKHFWFLDIQWKPQICLFF